jgi:BlaI family penicillinase repressor
MTGPEGTLTAAQHEILEVVWNGSAAGATVAEIWHSIGARRPVTRTTVLNQVDRLEKRGWLQRHEHEHGFRYAATRSRQDAASGLATEFVDSFFGGSASDLVMSLLGASKLDSDEIKKLRALLDARSKKRKPD